MTDDERSKIHMCTPVPRPGSHPDFPCCSKISHVEYAAMEPNERWAAGTVISYSLIGPDAAARAEFHAAIATLAEIVNLTFVERPGDPSATMRVTFEQNGSSWSNVGRDCLLVPAGQPTMNLGWPNDLGRTIHEIGHTLGLIHNQSIPNDELHLDPEKCYAYFGGPPNNWSREMVDSQVLYIFKGTLIGNGFDRASIMQYAVDPALTTDGKGVPWNQVLSDGDKVALGVLFYPKTGAPPSVPPLPVVPKPVAPPSGQSVAFRFATNGPASLPIVVSVGGAAFRPVTMTAFGADTFVLTLSVASASSSSPAPSAAPFDGHIFRGIGSAIVHAGEAVAAHVDFAELAKVALEALVASRGTPAQIGTAVLGGIVTDLPAILHEPANPSLVQDGS